MLVTATDMKNSFGKYLKSVTNDNEDIIITKNNERVARLVPYITDIDKYFSIRENALDYQYERRKVSYEEFMQIYEKSDSRMEFINGEIFLLASPNIFHQEILGNLYLLFKQYFKEKKCKPYLAPFDVHFKKQNIKDPDVMQPDLIVLCDIDNNVTVKGRYMGTPALTLEILSPSTKTKDVIYKLNTFMTSGVSEYWIVDPDTRKITIYSFIDYRVDKMETYKNGETASSEIFEGLTVNIDDLFDTLNIFNHPMPDD
jgi:prevent-host-death family protein